MIEFHLQHCSSAGSFMTMLHRGITDWRSRWQYAFLVTRIMHEGTQYLERYWGHPMDRKMPLALRLPFQQLHDLRSVEVKTEGQSIRVSPPNCKRSEGASTGSSSFLFSNLFISCRYKSHLICFFLLLSLEYRNSQEEFHISWLSSFWLSNLREIDTDSSVV